MKTRRYSEAQDGICRRANEQGRKSLTLGGTKIEDNPRVCSSRKIAKERECTRYL